MSRKIAFLLSAIFLVSSGFLCSKFVDAATRTWDGGGSTNNWSECANWSSDTCPVAGDVVTFNSTSTKNSTIDSGFISSIGRMNINAGYTGTVTQARSFTFTSTATTSIASGTFVGNTDDLVFSGPFSISGGTFTAGSQSVTHVGQVTISGGTYTASPLTTSIQNAYNHTSASGTFNPNGGTVVFNGSAGAKLLLNVTETFNNVEINKTGSGYLGISTGDTAVINGTLTLTDGYAGCSPSTGQGTFEVKGPLSATTDFTIDPSFAASATTNTPPCGGFLIDGTNTETLSIAGGTLGFTQVLTMNNANFTLNGSGSGLLTMRYFTLQSGTFNGTGFNLDISRFAQSGGTFVSGSGADTIGWTVDNTATNFNLTGGTFTATSGTLTVNTNFAHTGGTFNHNNGTVELHAPNTDETVYGSTTFYNLTVVAKVLSDPTAASASWTLPAGQTQTIVGTWTANGYPTASSSHRLKIQSSVPGTQAFIDPQGARVLSWLNVKDNNNVNALAIPCTLGFIDSGNLTNWDSCITVTESGGSTNVTEGGATDTYTVVLDYIPTANVTVTITPNSQITTSVPSLTFTTANWDTPQTVTVTAVDDAIVEGSHTGSITHTSTSSDPDYNGISVASVVPHITDNDVAGITVGPISGNTTEGGGTATFTVVLDLLPTADVTIPLSSSDLTEGTVSPSSLTFTTGNWNIPQTVTVTGVDDMLADGNIVYSIVTAAATSADGAYSGMNAADVSVTNIDNDAAGITVGAISGDTTEAGGTATFTVVLNLPPVADVVIGLSSSDTTEGTVAPSSLTFTSGNWSTPQTVTVTGVDDDVQDGDIVYSIITAAATSADGAYSGMNAADVSVTNIDNDTAGISVSAISAHTTEAGGTATFSTVLLSQPTADVTIGLSSSDTSEGTIVTSSLTFTAGNWNTPQIVTVTGVNDDYDDGDITYSILTAAATSSDGLYGGVNPPNVVVVNDDNDIGGIVISSISADTTEAGGTATFTVVLLSQPTADVVIGLSTSDATEGTIVVSSITFTTGNWATPQTVTVTGVDDADDDGDITYFIVTAAVTSADAGYTGVDTADVSVVNIDDDATTTPPSTGGGGGGGGGSTPTGTITVVKVVVNDNGQTKAVDDFHLFVNGSAVTSGEVNRYTANETYTASETPDAAYVGTFSGDCDASGAMTLVANANLVCTLTNDDIASSGTTSTTTEVPPVIAVEVVPSAYTLPTAATVTYDFTLHNTGPVPMERVTVVDDTCADIAYVSGDTNGDSILDLDETWSYQCSALLSSTSIGTVTATGWSNDLNAVDTASVTVVVEAPASGTTIVPVFPNTGVRPSFNIAFWFYLAGGIMGVCAGIQFYRERRTLSY